MYLVICKYVEKSGHSKNHEKSEGLATIIRRERMMNRRTERMEMRITMKTKEGWGLVLMPGGVECVGNVFLIGYYQKKTIILGWFLFKDTFPKLTPTPSIPWLSDSAGFWGK